MSTAAPVILQADRKLGETRMLRTELRLRGARVLMAETAEQALAHAALHPPDVVILDDELEGELPEYFRSTYPDAEVVLLSTRADQLTRGLGMGLLFHGIRPVTSSTLLEIIDEALPGRLSKEPVSGTVAPMVLCVDDDLQTLNSLSRLLNRHGYRVSTFEDPAKVLSAIPDVAPDVAVVDVAMPGLDGRELAKRIREQYRGLFPIVIHSARATDADRWSGFRHGADYYLPKPCEPHQLLDVVDYYADRLDPEERRFIESRL
jgi:twitching motility two-component system response regulator PilH